MVVELLETKEDQVILKIGEDVVPMDKITFETNFVQVEPGKYTMTNEYENMIKERVKDIENILPDLILAQNKNPRGIIALAEKTSAYCEKWEIDIPTAVREIGEIYKRFIERSVDMGVAFNESVYDLPENLKSKNRENSNIIAKENKPKHKPKGPTLGDLNPGLASLKDKFKTLN